MRVKCSLRETERLRKREKGGSVCVCVRKVLLVEEVKRERETVHGEHACDQSGDESGEK